MEKVQSELLGTASAITNAAGSIGKKAVGQKKTEAKKQVSNSPSAIAAKKAKASLSEQREAKKLRGSFQTYEAYKNIHSAPLKM